MPHAPSDPLLSLLLLAASRIHYGDLTVILPNGQLRRFTGLQAGPTARIIIHRARLARRMVTGGLLAFCEAYLDGDWSSPDLNALFVLALRNEQALQAWLSAQGWRGWLANCWHRLRPNTRAGSQRNIAYHYDLSNEFYAQFLDRSMTYSAGLYGQGPAGNDTLYAAQMRKYARLCDLAQLRPGMRVLEIGCGWGGFAEYAAQRGVTVTGLTISTAQQAWASRRLQESGLTGQAQILLQDYRDHRGTYDAVISIEMFEAVGERYWPAFFARLHDFLAAGGRAALQIITIAEDRFAHYRRSADFIQRYIFPGGMLPPPSRLGMLGAQAGLRRLADDGFAPDYATTLAEWQRRFQENWPTIRAMGGSLDARFKRLWELYLSYCEAGFRTGTIDVRQLAWQRP